MKNLFFGSACFLLSTLAVADIGPKPVAFFHWPDHGALSEITLLQCEDARCSISNPLTPVGPQRFSCCSSGCFSMAYGFSDWSQLIAKRDGKEIKSAPFLSKGMKLFYEVRASKKSIEVKAAEQQFSGDLQNRIQFCR